MKFFAIFFVIIMIVFTQSSCSFNYGTEDSGETTLPDITMTNMDYVRVENGKTTVRFRAETGDRYEKKRTMELSNYEFEQYNTQTGGTDATGRGGKAKIEMETRAVAMEAGVDINVESENMHINTTQLQWDDKAKLLSAPETSPVHITDKDGTDFTGSGFSADAKKRSWEFTSGVQGTYVHKDEEADDEAGGGTDVPQ
jgi:LPS export ABC transporter protein LptC